MADSFVTNPIYVDTDMVASYRNQTAVKTQNLNLGVQVVNLIITAPSGNATAAGTILVTDGNGLNLLQIPVNTSTPYPVAMTFTTALQWRDFLITGLTATGTALQLTVRQ